MQTECKNNNSLVFKFYAELIRRVTKDNDKFS